MKQYLDMVRTVQQNGTYKPAARANMPGTLSLFGHQFRVDLQKGFPAPTTKKLFWKGVVVELMWFLNGDTNVKFLNDNGVKFWNQDAYNYYLKKVKEYGKEDLPEEIIWCNPKVEQPYYREFTFEEFEEILSKNKELPKYGNYTLGDCGFQYGKVWRNIQDIDYWMNGSRPMPIHNKIDQIQNVIDSLRNSPEGRRHIVSAIDPAHDTQLALYWCHSMFQFNCRPLTSYQREDYYAKINNYSEQERIEMNPNASDEDVHQIMDEENIPKYYLDCQMYQRSMDIFLGAPLNIASYALLTHIFAKMCNMIPGEYIHTAGDAHIYDNHKEAIAEQLSREPRPLPTLKISDDIDWSQNIDYVMNELVNNEKWSSVFKLENYNPHPTIKAELSTGLVK